MDDDNNHRQYFSLYRLSKMMNDFDRAFDIVVGIEGGLAQDPNDPGGATKWGISQIAYPDLDVESLTLEEAKEIYRGDFWLPMHGDELPWSVAILLFDSAVNQGVRATTRMLQTTLNVKNDGIFGPVTLAATRGMSPELCAQFCAERIVRYSDGGNWWRYRRGWARRIFRIFAESLREQCLI